MSSSTQNVAKASGSAAQGPKRYLDTASLRKFWLSVAFAGDDWQERRPVILTIAIGTRPKENRKFEDLLLPERLELLYGQIEKMFKRTSFRTLDSLIDCLAPLTQSASDEHVRIVAETPTAVPRAEEGLARLVTFTRSSPEGKTQHKGEWVVKSHERRIKSLKVSCNISSGPNKLSARQTLSLHIRIIGDLEAGAPGPDSAEGADMWCRLAKTVCDTAEEHSYDSVEKLIGTVICVLLARYPVFNVGVVCERLPRLPGFTVVEGGERIEITRDRQELKVPYVGGGKLSDYLKAGKSPIDSNAG